MANMLRLSEGFTEKRKLQTLVENQTTYTTNHAAMHVFETHERAEKVMLKFSEPVLASMIKGKKVMHLRDYGSFDFFPGESLVLPANETMCIDFPMATEKNPTKCLAMAMDENMINKVLQNMNEQMPKEHNGEWKLMDSNLHFVNDAEIYQILQRLLYLFLEDHPSKDFFVDNMLRELIIRILQTNERNAYQPENLPLQTNNRLAHIIGYIRENLNQALQVDDLSKRACMSSSHFYRVFRTELGVSPIEFINNERIKLAIFLLQDSKTTLTEVYKACGFESRSYFNRVFKNYQQISPGAYQTKIQKNQ